jgi:MFS family permease
VINTLEGVDIEVNDKGGERRMICKMYVKEGVTFGNVMMLLTVKAGIYITATFWNVALVTTLEDPRYYDIDEDEIGRQTSYLLCGSYIAGFFGTVLFGYLFDAYGRRVTVSVSMALASVTLFFVLMPSPNVYPWLFILRCLFQFFLSGPWAVPLAADFIEPESMGKASIFGTMGLIVGNLVAYGGLLQMMVYVPNQLINYSTCATIGLFVSVLLFIYVQDMQFREENEGIATLEQKEDEMLKKEIEEATKNAKRT